MLKRTIYDEEHEIFRKSVRAWAEKEVFPNSEKWREEGCVSREIWKRAGEEGFLCMYADEKYGGLGLEDFRYDMILIEEIGTREAGFFLGLHNRIAGPYMQHYANDEQRDRYMPGIVSGDTILAIAMTEPDTGSDLAAIRPRAEDKGDHWIVNGQKIWTSYADEADWIFCLVRTDKTNKYQGITFMLFDMASEGVSTKPIKLISGNSPFCETFMDDVKVPKSYGEDIPAQVGQVNRGWDVAKYLLGHEREMISATGGVDRPTSLGAVTSRQGELDPVLRAEIAQFDVDALAFTAMSEKFLDEIKVGKAHPAQPNMMKYAGTELNKRRHELLMAAGGIDALEWEGERSHDGAMARDWLRTKANSIEGGTSEIQLNIIAKHLLQLPGA